MGSSIAAAFVAAGMMGFFVLGPLLKDATVTNHGHGLNKFAAGAMPVNRQGPAMSAVSVNPALNPAFNSPSRVAQDPVMIDKSKKIPSTKVWATFASSKELQPGGVVSGFQFGQEIAIAKSQSGKLFAISNKLPPTGQPATFGTVDGNKIIEPISGTAFNMATGKPEGKWCPSLVGNLLGRLVTPTDVPTFPVRDRGGKLQVQINKNAKAQFEQNYWRGVLDAQGKTDGGYY
jgi:nitrite reductase/ring-hydroxylating ferredoxin subunit